MSGKLLLDTLLPIRWRDLDAFNHVNNSTYLTYLEESRLQWMLGVAGLSMDDRAVPVMVASQLNYRRPLLWPGSVRILLTAERIGQSSVTIAHQMVHPERQDELYCDGSVTVVWIDSATGQSVPLPQAVRDAM